MKRIIALRGFQILLIILISASIGYFFGTNKVNVAWKNYNPIISVSPSLPPPGQNLNMQIFYSIVDKINSGYYDKTKIDSQKLLYGAISGMLESLDDPYTSFFPPKENKEFKTQLAGEFSGIGAELGMNSENRVAVTAPLEGSPAEKAGIKPGDLILKVDGLDTIGWTLGQAVDKIRGHKGTKVKLVILHEKQKESVTVEIVRDTIVIKSVKGWVKKVVCTKDNCLEKTDCDNCASLAYIRVSQFGDKTNDEWLSVVNSLYQKIKAEKDFRGIILDVRSNPGGYLTDAVFIASEFLQNGVVVSQEDGNAEKTSMTVNRRGLFIDFPLVVLVNKGSASASEIVAGALRDRKNAKLVGEKSFGKGTIQQAVDIDGGGSVHLSVGKWLTPNDTWVHGKGLEPDIKVEFDAGKSSDSAKLSKTPSGFDNQLQAGIKELLK